MNDLRMIIARNVQDLRCNAKMTQMQLADILNYSDKAISKWERGEAIPDVTVLKQIADYFGVTVDYLLTENPEGALPKSESVARQRARNRLVITILAIACVWFVSTAIFSVLVISECKFPAWMTYVYAVPVSAVVAVVFNSIWGRRRLNFPIVSLLIWGVLVSVYLTPGIFEKDLWVLFILGIPLQFSAALLPGIGLFRFRQK